MRSYFRYDGQVFRTADDNPGGARYGFLDFYVWPEREWRPARGRYYPSYETYLRMREIPEDEIEQWAKPQPVPPPEPCWDDLSPEAQAAIIEMRAREARRTIEEFAPVREAIAGM